MCAVVFLALPLFWLCFAFACTVRPLLHNTLRKSIKRIVIGALMMIDPRQRNEFVSALPAQIDPFRAIARGNLRSFNCVACTIAPRSVRVCSDIVSPSEPRSRERRSQHRLRCATRNYCPKTLAFRISARLDTFKLIIILFCGLFVSRKRTMRPTFVGK